jgi:hypothetical protein
MIKTSLDYAISEGFISKESAYCGINEEELLALRQSFPESLILVTYITKNGDSREVMRVNQFPRGNRKNPEHNIMNVQSVFAVANPE